MAERHSKLFTREGMILLVVINTIVQGTLWSIAKTAGADDFFAALILLPIAYVLTKDFPRLRR